MDSGRMFDIMRFQSLGFGRDRIGKQFLRVPRARPVRKLPVAIANGNFFTLVPRLILDRELIET